MVRIAVVLLSCSFTFPVAAQSMSRQRCNEVRSLVMPSADELAWRRIGWRDTLGAAVLEADEVGRPVLLWAMNGHPLGCV